MSDEAPKVIEFPHKSVQDVPAMLRGLADRIESGEVRATSLFCVAPVDDGYPEIFLFGPTDGDKTDPLIHLELARMRLLKGIAGDQ